VSQQTLARKWAPSLAGSPQVRSTAPLGFVKVRRRSRFEVDDDMPEPALRHYARQMFDRFVLWMKAEDGAEWDGSKPVITGPVAHFEAQAPDVQWGEGGVSRPIARNVQQDMSGSGRVDYFIETAFWVRERIVEVRSSVAESLFATQKPGVRPAREND
jgi:hypothetical protein